MMIEIILNIITILTLIIITSLAILNGIELHKILKHETWIIKQAQKERDTEIKAELQEKMDTYLEAQKNVAKTKKELATRVVRPKV